MTLSLAPQSARITELDVALAQSQAALSAAQATILELRAEIAGLQKGMGESAEAHSAALAAVSGSSEEAGEKQ